MKNGQKWLNLAAVTAVVIAFALIVTKNAPGNTNNKLLNVSYDPTRELYQKLNAEFVANYQKRTGQQITIVQSHGGSSRQARTVISGEQPADVVTLGVFSDVDALRKHGLIADDWVDRLPNHSRPYSSTIVFVVRKGNPKNIRDWPDLVRSDMQIVTANPKSSANGKLSILAAWGAIVTRGGSEAQARKYLKDLYQHVVEMDPGARTASMTFALRGIGDVQLTWENEAHRDAAESEGKLEVVYPPVSILAEPYVAWVDANVAHHGTKATAQAYLEFLFTDEAQATIASLGYRPWKGETLHQAGVNLPNLKLFPITAIASSWDDAWQKFFAENGILDTATGTLPK
ncbi:MAG: sulfate ABC transporter substrate-binding protein [Deltaproteobacteria bacterium]|nr:sulfate ABC transporter substrate-binding protein [Deltaproteobacteria bacterium]